MAKMMTRPAPVTIAAGGARLKGDLLVPPGARAVVLFAHGSGSSRLSPRNRFVADFVGIKHGKRALSLKKTRSGSVLVDSEGRTAGVLVEEPA